MRERIPREFSKLIWSLRRLLYPFLKPDQNSVCCSLLNYVPLKHKCVGFRKLQISAFPYDLGKCNFNQFCLGWKNIVCIILEHKGAVSPDGHPISFLATQMVSNKAYTFHINATDNLWKCLLYTLHFAKENVASLTEEYGTFLSRYSISHSIIFNSKVWNGIWNCPETYYF